MNLIIVFKGIEKSTLAEIAVRDRVTSVLKKFPELAISQTRITLEMHNSPQQAGQDVFSLSLYLRRKKANPLILKKSSPNMYQALADLCETALERLNRAGDKYRVKNINKARKHSQKSLSRALGP